MPDRQTRSQTKKIGLDFCQTKFFGLAQTAIFPPQVKTIVLASRRTNNSWNHCQLLALKHWWRHYLDDMKPTLICQNHWKITVIISLKIVINVDIYDIYVVSEQAAGWPRLLSAMIHRGNKYDVRWKQRKAIWKCFPFYQNYCLHQLLIREVWWEMAQFQNGSKSRSRVFLLRWLTFWAEKNRDGSKSFQSSWRF